MTRLTDLLRGTTDLTLVAVVLQPLAGRFLPTVITANADPEHMRRAAEELKREADRVEVERNTRGRQWWLDHD